MAKHSLRDYRARQREKYYNIKEKDSLKYAKGEEITRKIYRQDLDEFLARGWTLVQIFSNGISGSVTAIVHTTKTELEAKYR